MRLFPYIASFIAGTVGWKLGALLDIFVAILLSLIFGVLGFYYARKYQKEVLG
jgi:hypothetical protein